MHSVQEESLPGRIPLQKGTQLIVVRLEVFRQSPPQRWIDRWGVTAVVYREWHPHSSVDAKERRDSGEGCRRLSIEVFAAEDQELFRWHALAPSLELWQVFTA